MTRRKPQVLLSDTPIIIAGIVAAVAMVVGLVVALVHYGPSP